MATIFSCLNSREEKFSLERATETIFDCLEKLYLTNTNSTDYILHVNAREDLMLSMRRCSVCVGAERRHFWRAIVECKHVDNLTTCTCG